MGVDWFCVGLNREDQSGNELCVGVGKSGCEVLDGGVDACCCCCCCCCVVLLMIMSCFACFRVGH